MAARPSWRGALKLAGFPVHVAIYNRRQSKSADSFKTVGPDKKPIHQVKVQSKEYAKLEKDPKAKIATIGTEDTDKAIPHGEEFVVIDPAEALERTDLVEASAYVEIASLPMELATGTYVVVPDEKVPGSDESVNWVWNGLKSTGVAYVTRVVFKDGSRDQLVAFYANAEGMHAVTLSYDAELRDDLPSFEFTKDGAAASLVDQFIGDEVVAYDGAAFRSEWRDRRDKVVAAAVKGKKLPVAKKPKAAKTDTGGLAAALAQAVKDSPKAKKAPAKKTSKAKAKA